MKYTPVPNDQYTDKMAKRDKRVINKAIKEAMSNSTQNDEIGKIEKAIDEGFAESEKFLKGMKTPFDKSSTQNNHETHTACIERIKKEGASATCCHCNPHEGCTLNIPMSNSTQDSLKMKEIISSIGK